MRRVRAIDATSRRSRPRHVHARPPRRLRARHIGRVETAASGSASITRSPMSMSKLRWRVARARLWSALRCDVPGVSRRRIRPLSGHARPSVNHHSIGTETM
jgi:hypothetical protein